MRETGTFTGRNRRVRFRKLLNMEETGSGGWGDAVIAVSGYVAAYYSVAFAGHLSSPSTLPVVVDYPADLLLRHMALANGNLPEYLLAPEVSAQFHYVPDLHRKMLWNTGACIKEALALTRRDSAWWRPTLTRSWPRSSSAPKRPAVDPGEHPQVSTAPSCAAVRSPVRLKAGANYGQAANSAGAAQLE